MRMMAWILSKCPGRENVDALILLHERSKDEEIAKLTERLLSMTVAAPSSLDEAKRGGLDANSIAEIETRWFNNAKEVTRWWRVNRESLVWDSWDGMYRLAKASGK
jgi:hypothetical protein